MLGKEKLKFELLGRVFDEIASLPRESTLEEVVRNVSWDLAKDLSSKLPGVAILVAVPELWTFIGEYDFYGVSMEDVFQEVLTSWLCSLIPEEEKEGKSDAGGTEEAREAV